MQLLCSCGRPLDAGRTTGAGGSCVRCLVCLVQPPRIVGRRNTSPPRRGICVCCGQEGAIVGRGLASACYQRWRSYGKLDEWRTRR
jgi:hypothetical protein